LVIEAPARLEVLAADRSVSQASPRTDGDSVIEVPARLEVLAADRSVPQASPRIDGDSVIEAPARLEVLAADCPVSQAAARIDDARCGGQDVASRRRRFGRDRLRAGVGARSVAAGEPDAQRRAGQDRSRSPGAELARSRGPFFYEPALSLRAARGSSRGARPPPG
jgi:hypothetical protein